ncbi:MAG: mechanosensitive ion channel family protein [Methylococcales bacterium]|nr:mechanosensitive ion channel family protein [Methylococcales bacterium]
MQKIVFFLMLILSFSTLSEPISSQKAIKKSVDDLKNINSKLLEIDDETVVNEMLKNKIDTLDRLIEQLRVAKSSHLLSVVSKNKLAFLESRIKANTERGNDLAAQRDQIKLEGYRVKQSIRFYLEYLIQASKNYQTIEAIVKKSQTLLDESLSQEKQLVLPEGVLESNVFLELKNNHQDFLLDNDSFQDMLEYIISNPRKIASVHWFQEFSLLSAISYVNHFEFVQSINHRLVPFKIDTGGTVLSFVIFFLIYFTHPFIFKCTNWCIDAYVADKDAEHQELIHHEIKSPVRALIVFFGINLGTYAFFYKTDYRTSLEGISFSIYSLIFIWLFFKIIDSIILFQLQKISRANKELRKELLNLGVQAGKGLIVIVVFAFGLSHFGISLTAIMSTLGVGGLAFALAAKDTLSNLFGGITILLDNVFRMGDWVKVADVEGTVAEIGLRSTTIRTFDNALITVPNSLVSISSVMNWNRRAVGRRIKLHVGVTYESNMDDLRQGLDDIREMLRNHPGIANPKQSHSSKRRNFKFSSQADTQGIKSTQLVFLDRYNDASIGILIYCFTKTVDWAEWLAIKEDVLFKIAEILEKNRLEFAYPTQVIIHRPDNKKEMGAKLLPGQA